MQTRLAAAWSVFLSLSLSLSLSLYSLSASARADLQPPTPRDGPHRPLGLAAAAPRASVIEPGAAAHVHGPRPLPPPAQRVAGVVRGGGPGAAPGQQPQPPRSACGQQVLCSSTHSFVLRLGAGSGFGLRSTVTRRHQMCLCCVVRVPQRCAPVAPQLVQPTRCAGSKIVHFFCC